MGTLSLTYVRLDDADGESIRSALQTISNAIAHFNGQPPLPVTPETAAIAEVAAPLRLNGHAADPPGPAPKPRKKYQRRKKAAEDAEARGSEPSREEQPVRAKPPSTIKLHDKIAEQIEQRGPLTASRLAQLLTTSEKDIRRSATMSRGRFTIDEDDRYALDPNWSR